MSTDPAPFPPGVIPEVIVYTLEQVAAMTGWSARSLLDECRNGGLDHVNRHGTRGMTLEQIRSAAQKYTRRAEVKQATPHEVREQVRQANATRMAKVGRSRKKAVA